MSTDTSPIIKERTFNAPVEKVWKAITDKDEMKKWYFDIAEFKPEPGFEFDFYGGKEDVQYHHLCKILEVIPDKKLSHTWRYEKEKGSSILTFELFPEGKQTRLKLTHSGLETFPQDKPDFAKSSFNEGWNYIINTSLKNYLEG